MSLIKQTKKVRAVMIIEVIGKPKEHLTETLEGMIKQISDEKGVKINEKKINEPTLLKPKTDEQKIPEGFYTTFAEIEVEIEEILYLAMLMFKYMPAHIEILDPETITLTNNGLNDILNELTRRLHGYDEVARIIQMEKNILEKKLRELMPEKEADEKK